MIVKDLVPASGIKAFTIMESATGGVNGAVPGAGEQAAS
jgi:hypothetical protein